MLEEMTNTFHMFQVYEHEMAEHQEELDEGEINLEDVRLYGL